MTVVGTLEYMAPEVARVFRGAATQHRINYKAADVFSLGVVLFELLVGKVPDGPDQSLFQLFFREKQFQRVCW
jgi:serine/threonine protein kinase